jgi:hypothetical protein
MEQHQRLRDQMYINAYRQKLKRYILTSRFNNSTWLENKTYRERNSQIGCVYAAPLMISGEIPIDSIVFMLEMNNDTNKIMGIGMIKNHPNSKQLNIYKNQNYTRVVYTGKYRIDRSEMTEDELVIMMAFDTLCFTGNHHMKRGQGLLSFPVEMLCRCSKILDLVDFITNMFKIRMSKQQI